MYSKKEIIEMILLQMPESNTEFIINRLIKLNDYELSIIFEKSTGGNKLEKFNNNYSIKFKN